MEKCSDRKSLKEFVLNFVLAPLWSVVFICCLEYLMHGWVECGKCLSSGQVVAAHLPCLSSGGFGRSCVCPGPGTSSGWGGDVLQQEVTLLRCLSTPRCLGAGFAQVFVFGVDSVLQSGEPWPVQGRPCLCCRGLQFVGSILVLPNSLWRAMTKARLLAFSC